jgi:hypothetical protein
VRCRSPSLQSPTHYYIEPLYIVVAGHAAMVTPCREPSRAAPGTILNWLWTGASQPRPNHQGNKRHPCRSAGAPSGRPSRRSRTRATPARSHIGKARAVPWCTSLFPPSAGGEISCAAWYVMAWAAMIRSPGRLLRGVSGELGCGQLRRDHSRQLSARHPRDRLQGAAGNRAASVIRRRDSGTGHRPGGSW